MVPQLTTGIRLNDNMKTIMLNGIQVPIPADWNISENGRSYSGDAGLADPRETEDETPVDEQRAKVAEKNLSSYSPEVELIEVQGTQCLSCRYMKNGIQIISYSLHGKNGRTVDVVYTFRPGNDEIISSIHKAIVGEHGTSL